MFTVGHSNHALEHFLGLLWGQRIALLADIRRFPVSRKFPHFDRNALAQALHAAGIEYRWFEALGGRRHAIPEVDPSLNAGLHNAGFRHYADYMQTEEFRQALRALMHAAAERTTAIMCAESVFWRCHRRLVSDALLAAGWDVQHIFPDGSCQPHVLTAGAAIRGQCVTYPAPRTLFDPS